MTASHRNIEVKVRCADLPRVRDGVLALGATPHRTEHQRDTYFHVPPSGGRLKLREREGLPAQLVQYYRADTPGVRDSTYHLVEVPDPAGLRALLAAGLGIRGVIDKQREILLWQDVRIHLDTVVDLGTFVEFEAVMHPGRAEDEARACVDQLAAAGQLDPAECLGGSYADLRGL